MEPNSIHRGFVAAFLAAFVAPAIGGCASAGSSSAAPHNRVAALAGYRWRVIEIRVRDGVLAVARSRHGEIDFTRDGYVLGNDTVNGLQARYRSSGVGYEVTDFVSGAVGSTGGDPDQTRTVEAIDDVFAATSASPSSTPPGSIDVGVDLRGSTLVLMRGATSLTLVRMGTEPNFIGPAGPSQTPTTS